MRRWIAFACLAVAGCLPAKPDPWGVGAIVEVSKSDGGLAMGEGLPAGGSVPAFTRARVESPPDVSGWVVVRFLSGPYPDRLAEMDCKDLRPVAAPTRR
jgi:hypothetical protein